jgi:CubicO group peptidase (beta-lactamase class C family)
MRHLIGSATRVLVLAAIAALTVSLSGGRPITGLSTEPASAADRQNGFAERLNEDRWLAAFDVPGVAIALVRNGRPTWSRGYGRADVESGAAVTPDTVFQVGSISKSVSAWGVMRLVQQGKLDLDAPVERYLTRWHLPRSSFDANGVTIGRLLNHSAGLNSQDYSPISARPLPSLEASLSGESGGPDARQGTDDVRITMEPGRQQSYSNGGYSLLQLAVEEVTGQSFAQYMRHEVLAPLGMTHSSFTFQPELSERSATGYDVAGRAVPRSAFTEKAAGALQTTANDMAIFVAAGMRGPHGESAGRGVLTPESVSALFARERLPDGSTASLGYEVQTLRDGTHAAGHGGKNIGWRAEFVTLPERREGIVILTNSERMDGILGLTEQAWTGWLGTGDSLTSRMQQSSLQSFYAQLLLVAGLLVLASGICVALVWRRPRARPRQWMWRDAGRRRGVDWAVRAACLGAAAAAAGAWILLPVRQDLASITPVRVTLVTAALLVFCVVISITALTRRTNRPAALGTA